MLELKSAKGDPLGSKKTVVLKIDVQMNTLFHSKSRECAELHTAKEGSLNINVIVAHYRLGLCCTIRFFKDIVAQKR